MCSFVLLLMHITMPYLSCHFLIPTFIILCNEQKAINRMIRNNPFMIDCWSSVYGSAEDVLTEFRTMILLLSVVLLQFVYY